MTTTMESMFCTNSTTEINRVDSNAGYSIRADTFGPKMMTKRNEEIAISNMLTTMARRDFDSASSTGFVMNETSITIMTDCSTDVRDRTLPFKICIHPESA